MVKRMRCARCGRKLSKKTVKKIAEVLGVKVVLCIYCLPGKIKTSISRGMLVSLKWVNKKHGKTLKKLKD